MKKIGMVLILAALMLLTKPWVFVSAETAEGSCGETAAWHYDDVSATLTISGSGAMGDNCETSFRSFKSKVRTVVIEEGITKISRNAFSHMEALQAVQIPPSVYILGDYAFAYCTSLTEMPEAAGLAQIGESAFAYSGLQTARIPERVTQISHGVFSYCSSLKEVSLHNEINLIGSYAFSQCKSLTQINIPDSVTTIAGSAFSGCTRLQTVNLGSGLRTLGGNVFSDCGALTEIRIPDKVTEIGGYTFSGCKALESVYIGAGVSEINASAFRRCKALKAFSVSDSNGSFCTDRGILYNKNKTKLVLCPQGFSGALTVLSGTQTVGCYACYECTGMTELTIPGSVLVIDDYAFDGCSGLGSVSLTEGLQTIGTYSFSGCNGLKEILFPATLKEVQACAFSRCTALATITFQGVAPRIGGECFDGVRATVYYPQRDITWDGKDDLYGGQLQWVAPTCQGAHTPKSIPGVLPTCTEEGISEGKRCGVCGEVILGQKSLPAAGHSYGPWKTLVQPTEEAVGQAERTCTVCGETEKKTVEMEKPEETRPQETAPKETRPAPTETTVWTEQTEPAEVAVTKSTEATEAEETVPPYTGPVETGPVPEEETDITENIVIVAVCAVALIGGTVGFVLFEKHRG